jgi:hypothetical protein
VSKYKKPEEVAKIKTRLFTYEIVMTVQVLANNSEEADSLLDNQGGYVNTRKVLLIDEIDVFEEK